MYTPAQGCFEESEVVLLRDGFDVLDSAEGGVPEVAVSVHGPLTGVGLGVAAFRGDAGGFIFAGEDAAGELRQSV